MIVTKTPLRVSFFGGGSDIPEFYKNNYGMTLSTTIDSYIHLAINSCDSNHIRMTYSEMEYVKNVDDLKHDRVKECLKMLSILNKIEICSFSQIPTKGTGLGSSSTFTVGLVNGLTYLKNKEILDKKSIAELACHIELDLCNQPIGKQDQYAASFGGLNVFHYHNDFVDVEPLKNRVIDINSLKENLMIYNTGITRQASSVLNEQVELLKTNMNVKNTKKIVDITKESVIMLKKNKIDCFGELLDESWNIKKNLASNISNDYIDNMYEEAKKYGAIGGKILGAGGGGYMLLYIPSKDKNNFLNSDFNKKYKRFNFNFETRGTFLNVI